MSVPHAQGALVGVHIGDSLGATAEFSTRSAAQRIYPADVDQVDIVGGGPFGWSPGDPTDDTDLTVALVRGYLAAGPDGTSDTVVREAADRMAAWRNAGPRDIGGATASGLSTYLRTGDPYTSGGTSQRSQGNGSLMRTMPVAVARAYDPDRRTYEAAALSGVTHRHPNCTDGCVMYVDLAARLIREPISTVEARTVVRGWIDGTLSDPDRFATDVVAAVADAAELIDRDGHVGQVAGVNDSSSGWVLTALKLALVAAATPRPAAELLVEVVRLGGDTDTNGAIVGGLLGARDGISSWPARWVDICRDAPLLRDQAGRGRRLGPSGPS